MNATKTWCVCGQETDNDPWELVEEDLGSREEAESWLRENHSQFQSYSGFYIDAEANDGIADTYYERNPDGSLSMFAGCDKVYFAD